jgi:3-dehydroquinate synthase
MGERPNRESSALIKAPIQQEFRATFRYPVYFTENVFARDNALFAEVVGNAGKRRVLLVVDEGVADAHPHLLNQAREYGQTFAECFELCAPPLVVPGGEQVKNDERWLREVLNATNDCGIDRHSYIVAVGGGAVLDMAGFAASIAHRGIRHVRIPTTVLSQNDSGVGVKNGINAYAKKNFLGTFAPPSAVINDIGFLQTLSSRDWRSGIAEAVKVSLIRDAAFFEQLERCAAALTARHNPAMLEIIYHCARLHVEHIANGDPFESGSSRPLDFGHWAAHKLEQLTRYELRHGEAVATGIALDTTYCGLKGMMPSAGVQRVLGLLEQLGFDLYVPALEERALMDGLEEFRQHLGGELTLMLLADIGRGLEVHEMDEPVILQSVSYLKSRHLNRQASL